MGCAWAWLGTARHNTTLPITNPIRLDETSYLALDIFARSRVTHPTTIEGFYRHFTNKDILLYDLRLIIGSIAAARLALIYLEENVCNGKLANKGCFAHE